MGVFQHDARRVCARRAGEPATRVRTGPTQVQPGDRRAVLRPAQHRAHRVELIERVLAVENVAAGQAIALLEIDRRQDLARQDERRQVGTYLELLTKLIEDDNQKDGHSKAILALSALVGAVSMARAVNDEQLSQEILKSAADELKAYLS